MGYLTTITIHNDALHCFEEYPKEFGEAIFKGIREAQREHREVSVPFSSYANYISVQPSRHADDETLYIHSGNCVTDLDPWSEDFMDLIERQLDLAKSLLKKAKDIIKMAEKSLANKSVVEKTVDSV